jgi:hypothetical protein
MPVAGRTALRRVGCGLLAVLASCSAVRRSRGAPPTHEIDSALFAEVMRNLPDTQLIPMRVDPRPLANDPRLVSLHDLSALEIGGPVSTPFADTTEVRQRRQTLRRLGLEETDALRDLGCPGALAPPSARIDSLRRARCPTRGYRSVAVALPRSGGPYWPNNVDERASYQDSVYSMRVISRDMTPQGSAEHSSDFVFRRHADRWRLVARKDLIIVE